MLFRRRFTQCAQECAMAIPFMIPFLVLYQYSFSRQGLNLTFEGDDSLFNTASAYYVTQKPGLNVP